MDTMNKNDLHAAIMNLTCTPPERSSGELRVAYKLGHRDARHAAAELALTARSPVQEAQSAPAVGEPKRVYLVSTGVVLCGEETYTRHEDAPPPLCDSECLYSTPTPAVEGLTDEEIVSQGRIFSTNNEYAHGRCVSLEFTPTGLVMLVRALLAASPVPMASSAGEPVDEGRVQCGCPKCYAIHPGPCANEPPQYRLPPLPSVIPEGTPLAHAVREYARQAVYELAPPAASLREKASMPWSDAEQLALKEAGIDDSEIDELIGECGYAGLSSLLTTEDELRQFTRSVLVLVVLACKLSDATRELLDDTQHANHKDCEDGGFCPVRDTREALRLFDAALSDGGRGGKSNG